MELWVWKIRVETGKRYSVFLCVCTVFSERSLTNASRLSSSSLLLPAEKIRFGFVSFCFLLWCVNLLAGTGKESSPGL